MFSLIITIVSVALAAALTLAVVFYVGPTVFTGNSSVSGTAYVNQSQILLKASAAFREANDRWPSDLEELVSSGYLSALPGGPTQWSQIASNHPHFWLPDSVPEGACRELNLLLRGDDGVLRAARPGLSVQCFGSAAPFTVVAYHAGTASLATIIPSVDPTKEVSDDPAWAIPPSGEAPTPIPDPFPDGAFLSRSYALEYMEPVETFISKVGIPTYWNYYLVNVGDVPLYNVSSRLSGSARFTVTNNNCGYHDSMPPGGNCLLRVTFKPTAKVTSSANIEFSFDGKRGPATFTLAITGKGT